MFTSLLPPSASCQNEEGTGDLRIKNVQIRHEGRYTCMAQTVVDSDTAYADLKVVGQLPQIQSLFHFWCVFILT